MAKNDNDVVIVGDGVSGLTTGIFTGRQGLETTIIGTGESMLQLNAHIENFPGFPRGINPDLLLKILREQANDSGCECKEAEVTDVDRHPDGGFVLATGDSQKFDVRTEFLVCATAGNADYLRQLDLKIVDTEHGAYVHTDKSGRTSIDGLYVTGGLANKPLQAIISAGHGAEVGVQVIEDSDVPFAHDWTVLDGFFTEDDGAIPPGCEEISEDQLQERQRRSAERMNDIFK